MHFSVWVLKKEESNLEVTPGSIYTNTSVSVPVNRRFVGGRDGHILGKGEIRRDRFINGIQAET